MYVIKSNRKTNSYTVRKINRITKVVRVGRRGLKGDPGGGLVESVNGKQGVVVLNATDVGADPVGSSSQALQDAKDYTDTEVSTLDSSLATVAKTGSYNDLSNKPTIPSIAGLATEAQVQDVQDNLDAHEADTANPHNVTAAQVGLGNVSNLAPADMPVSTAQQTALNAKANASDTVNLTGNQTVAGVKTFSSSPVVPTATTNTQAVNKAQMDNADALKLNISDNRVELRGVGFPNGVVSAPVGTTYVDTAATNGAIEWKKATGTGNTGWVVSVGDTGWRRLNIALMSSGYIYYRRIGQDVSVAIGGGLYDSIQYATDAPIDTRRRIVATGDVPVGFRFSRAQTALLTSNSEFIAGTVYHSGAADANYIELRNSGRAIVTSEFIRPASVIFQTNESWPVLLPGSSV